MDNNQFQQGQFQQPQYQQPQYQQPQYQYQQPQIPAEYKPISMWGYFGYELLFSIPIIGFVCLLILAFTASNKNVKNFARSYFCFFIVALILMCLFFAVMAPLIAMDM